MVHGIHDKICDVCRFRIDGTRLRTRCSRFDNAGSHDRSASFTATKLHDERKFVRPNPVTR